jgi:sugar (pentulose or hexulose) kinase
VGLSITTGAREILRAIREGLALRVAAASRILRAQFPNLNLVVASGGGLASVPGFAQLLADATGISVLAAEHLEATSRGAAVTALRALGIWTGAEPAPLPEGERFEPHWDHYADYQERLAQQEDLIRRCT